MKLEVPCESKFWSPTLAPNAKCKDGAPGRDSFLDWVRQFHVKNSGPLGKLRAGSPPHGQGPVRGGPGSGALIYLFFLMVMAAMVAAAQDTVLRVDVKLVSVFVNVTDKNGAIVGGLTRDDFNVTEDGRPQEIAVFERQSEVPLNLTLAIDTSGSVKKDMSEEADAARRFVRAILRPQDHMSLLQFATDVKELSGFTNSVGQIDRGLERLHSDYATALYDAVLLGSDGLGKKDGRRVLILVSDGGDTASSTSYQQALESALRNEVMIYSVIDVPIAASAGRELGGEHALITLAEQTGGKSFYVGDGGLDQAFTLSLIHI